MSKENTEEGRIFLSLPINPQKGVIELNRFRSWIQERRLKRLVPLVARMQAEARIRRYDQALEAISELMDLSTDPELYACLKDSLESLEIACGMEADNCD